MIFKTAKTYNRRLPNPNQVLLTESQRESLHATLFQFMRRCSLLPCEECVNWAMGEERENYSCLE